MNHEIVDSFAMMAREKGIDRDILIGIIEDIFGMMVKKKYGLEPEGYGTSSSYMAVYVLKDAIERAGSLECCQRVPMALRVL